MCHPSFSKFSNYLMIITFLFIIAIIHHHRYDRFQKFMTTQEMIRFYVISVQCRHPAKLVHFSHLTHRTQHAAQSTQHKARLNLNVRYIQRFVPGFLLFIVPLKSRNIPIQFLCQSSQYFQIQLTN